MPPQKKLTDRDTQLLEALIKCGALSSRQVQEIFGGVSCYHYKRLKELEKRGYLRRIGHYIQITQQGAKAVGGVLGQEDIPIRIREPWQRQQRASVADILIYLDKNYWTFKSSREIKRETGISSSAYINCYITSNGKGYAVYMLSDNPHKQTIRGIKNELDRLIEHGISKAIIFCPSPESMKKFGTYHGRTINELLVLPFPYGLSLLNNMEQIQNNIQSMFSGFKTSARPFADYEKDNTLVTVLVYNDLIKKENLGEYLNHARARENRELIIVCLESQSAQFAAMFPGVKQQFTPNPTERGNKYAINH